MKSLGVLQSAVQPALAEAVQHDSAQAFHEGWDAWLLSSLARGVSPERLKRRLVDRGFGEALVEQRIHLWKQSPALRVIRGYAGQVTKMAGLLNVLGELRAQDHAVVPRVDRLTPATFYKSYVHENRPVVMRSFGRGWPALRRWTPRYLLSQLGDIEIDITDDREHDPRFEDNFVRHVRRCRFSEFVETIEKTANSNNRYLVAKNSLLKNPAAKSLFEDFSWPEGFVTPGADPSEASLWVGPAGTLTPMHHDACNIIFTQIYGRKRVRLVAPIYLPRIYNDRNCFTSFDPEAPDYAKFPLMRGVPIASVEVSPGDTLFIPVGWWHHVRSLSVSISLSVTRFILPRAAHVWNWRA